MSCQPNYYRRFGRQNSVLEDDPDQCTVSQIITEDLDARTMCRDDPQECTVSQIITEDLDARTVCKGDPNICTVSQIITEDLDARTVCVNVIQMIVGQSNYYRRFGRQNCMQR
jgi:hypothetical protein